MTKQLGKCEQEKISEKIDAARLFVAAIDFGTTYSGYAYSPKSDPSAIETCKWKNGKFESSKAPTSVLLDLKKNFLAFGYEAENKFVNNAGEDKPDVLYYFRRFKMILHNQTIDMDTTIEDVNGVEMIAFDIFTAAIKYLKEQMLAMLQRRIMGTTIKDVHFVLTVPAIWEDQSKMFMRRAAEQAGIEGSQLTIALEPEAASIYCQELKTNKEHKEDTHFSDTVKKGSKCMVIDLGGGTADITVHQRQDDDTLEEVVPASGGPWGGMTIDKAYLEFLEMLFSEAVIEKFKDGDLYDYTELIQQFEVKKRSITSERDTDVVITMPMGLLEIIKSKFGGVEKAIKRSTYARNVSFLPSQKLLVKPEIFRDFFKPTIDALIKHVDQLLKDANLVDLKNIIMVGGFSECKLVTDAVKKKFSKMLIIIPPDAGLAVLRGAVLFGHQPEKISKRVLKKTYGIQSWPEWNSDLHPEGKRVLIDGTERCKDVFFRFAHKGEKVEVGHSISQVFEALKPDEKTLECTVYITDDTNPKYVTDVGCQSLGNLIVPLPPLRFGETLEIEESMIFGGTEILFRARNLKTGDIYETQFQF